MKDLIHQECVNELKRQLHDDRNTAMTMDAFKARWCVFLEQHYERMFSVEFEREMMLQ